MALNNIAWIGRFTGPKGELAQRLLHEVVPLFPQCRFTFIGGGTHLNVPAHLAQHVRVVSEFIHDIRSEINKYDLIIGAGRVAMEAMRCGKPVVAVGERRYVGLIDAHTIELAKQTNFGDSDERNDFNLPELTRDLQKIIAGEKQIDTSRYAEFLQDYDAAYVHEQVMQVYRQATVERYLRQFTEIPVLMYHRVVDAPLQGSRYNIYVTRDELEWQIKKLQRRGFNSVTFSDLWHGAQPERPVILTFDDGYLDNYENLLPLLDKHRARAVVFALGDRTLHRNEWDIGHGEPPAVLMNNTQLKACHDSGRIEIGSHGMTHPHLPMLEQEQLNYEVQTSREVLQHIIHAPVHSFAYPYGDFSDREVQAVKHNGYQFGIGTVNGPLSLSADVFRIRRINMFPGTKPSAFWKKTSGFYLRYCKLKGKDF